MNWTQVEKELQSKTIDEMHELELEDYHAYLDRLTEGMTTEQRLSAYALFGKLLRATYEGKAGHLRQTA